MIWTHPYAASESGRCWWSAGGAAVCQEPANASVHQRSTPHAFSDRPDGRCGHDVGGGVLCGITRLLPVHAKVPGR